MSGEVHHLRRVTASVSNGASGLVDEKLPAHPSHLGWFAWRVWESDEAWILPPIDSPSAEVGGLPQPKVLFYVNEFPPNSEGGMHATDSIDFACVMSGEVYMEQEGAGEILLRAGDFLVQLGGRHLWRTGDSGCTVSYVMLRTGRIPAVRD
jgi:quercetin dioxygenase-like cupin family protein